MGGKKFVPMLISFDERGFQQAEKEAKEKLQKLDEGSVWVHRVLDLEENKINLKRFHLNMMEYFKDAVLAKYKEVNLMGLSAGKLIEAKEIPVHQLQKIQSSMKEYNQKVKCPLTITSQLLR